MLRIRHALQQNSYYIQNKSVTQETKDTIKKFDRQMSNWSKVLVVIIGIFLFSIIGILKRLSMLGKSHLPYNPYHVNLIVEFGKFVVSMILLIKLEGLYSGIKSITYLPLNEWFLFSVPSIIYSISTNLTFYIFEYMDPGTNSIVSQTKIIWRTLLWWIFFRKSIDKNQCVSLFLLFVASVIVVWPSDKNNINSNYMYSIWPNGPILVQIASFLSSFAGIYSEWILKNYGKNRSIYVDNIAMYLWGIVSNIIQIYYMEQLSTNNLFNGFNKYTYILIVAYVSLGLCISVILKYLNSIIKLMMNGAAIVMSGILTFMIFGLNWTIPYTIGLIIVVYSVLSFKLNTHIFDMNIKSMVMLFTISSALLYCFNHSNHFLINKKFETFNRFNNCIYNDIENYYTCPKGINYYYGYLDTNVSGNNCYWFKDDSFKSFWRCTDDIKHSIDDTNVITNISECAIIFNSGALLLKKYGNEIDSHSLVYRINYPPTTGYEHFVGNKTSFHAVHFWGTAQGPTAEILTNYNNSNIPFIFLSKNRQEMKRFNDNKHINNITWITVSHSFIGKCNKHIRQYIDDAQIKKKKFCSTGLKLLFYALQNCKSIDLYGLSDDKCLPIHYYEPPPKECSTILYSNASNHDIQLEHMIIRDLARQYHHLNIKFMS